MMIGHKSHIFFSKAEKGNFGGANVDTWALLSEKLGLSFNYEEFGSYAGAYTLLAQRKIDLVLPSGFMSLQLFQVVQHL